MFPANNNPFSTFLPEAKGKLGRGIRSLASPRSDGWTTTTTRISGFVKITISRGESKEKERGESFIALHVSIPWNNLLANIFVQICYLRWRCLNSEARDIHKRPISRRYRRLHFASITTLSCDRRRKVEGKIKRAGGRVVWESFVISRLRSNKFPLLPGKRCTRWLARGEFKVWYPMEMEEEREPADNVQAPFLNLSIA